MDVATIYAEARERVVELVRGADPGELDKTVPATPAWTGRELFAHMVGVPADVMAGRLDGVGSHEWGQRQVDERAGKSIDELVEEWTSSTSGFDEMVRNAPEAMVGALSADLLHHELDLRALLGEPVPDGLHSAIEPSLNFMVGFLGRRIDKAGLPALRVQAGNEEWTVGQGEVAATLTTKPIELFRILAGRRSAAQVKALDWSGDPEPYLPVLSAFGPLSETDVDESFS